MTLLILREKHYLCIKVRNKNRKIPIAKRVNYSLLVHDKELWLAHERGLTILNTSTLTEMPIPEELADKRLQEQTVLLIHEMPDGTVFVNTDNNGISTMLNDRNGNVWTGYDNHGFEVRAKNNTRFNNSAVLYQALNGKSVSCIGMTSASQLMLLTMDEQLFAYDLNSQKLHEVETNGLLKRRLLGVTPSRLYADSKGRLWLIHQEKLYQAQLSNGAISLSERTDLDDIKAGCITESKDGTVWVSGMNSNRLYRLKTDAKTFEPVAFEMSEKSFVYSLLPLDGNLMVLGVAFNNPAIVDTEQKTVKRIMLSENLQQIGLVTCLASDHTGRIWIGTRGAGVYRYYRKKDKAERIGEIDCDEICSIAEDHNGNMWVSTLNGLYRYDTGNGKVSHFDSSNGIGGNQFNEQAVAVLPNNTLVFGGTHGLTVYNPDLKVDDAKPQLHFEDVRVNNQLIMPGREIELPLAYEPKATLDYDQNNFSVSFAAIDYGRHERTHYFYKLEGYNDKWIDNRNITQAQFANVPSGHYKLRVKVAASLEDKSVAEAEMDIRIVPALWNRWWAWLIYICLAATVGWQLFKSRREAIRVREHQQRLELEKEQEARVNRMNMSFFANISHEFRTPLTMISGPTAMLAKKENMTEDEQKMLNTIRWNVNRMLKLVNQLMDFNKLESDALRLKVRQQDVIGLLKQSVSAYQVNIQEKHIALKAYGFEDSYETPVDEDKIDKVISNLISNALKFTPAEGEITFGFDVIQKDEAIGLFAEAQKSPANTFLKIYVSDNGISIPDDKLERIFERYYQVENNINYGTGIGLYYSRRLLQLHHGWIKAENISSGGVIFTFIIPAEDIYSPEEHATDGPVRKQEDLLPKGALEAIISEEAASDKKTVMVIDDDPGVVNYLKLILANEYNVHSAFDASSGFEQIKREMPDIILSDVAMPGKDGYELCRDIKADSSICHIPVILVTAKTTTENQIEGLNTGADAYVTKPFDPDYLLALIQSQLQNRDRVRQLLSDTTSADEIEEDTLAPQDAALMKELYELMDKEMMNSELNITMITKTMCISRSKFYYKIKALTGDNPNVFFRKYKLNRAARLLEEGKYNISEIADRTGFSSPTIFGRNFKQQFGMTPTEYKNNLNSNEHKA